jgi:4-amino-4-deoxy-L-arabinose transferase-like glycosyltransferase
MSVKTTKTLSDILARRGRLAALWETRYVPWLLVCVVFLVLSTATARTRLPVCDEAWYASPAVNLGSHGFMGTTVLESAAVKRLQGVDKHTYWVMPLYILAETVWFKEVGFGIFRQRLLSTLWGLVFLVSWAVFLSMLMGNRKTAFLAISLLSVDFYVIVGSAVGRTDMMCAALGAAALGSYVSLRQKHLLGAIVISQALVAASGMTHPNGLLYFAGLLLTTLWLDGSRIRKRHLVVAALPYLVCAVAWGFYVEKNPADFFAQFGASAVDRLAGGTSVGNALKQEIEVRYLGAYGFVVRNFDSGGRNSTGFRHLQNSVLVVYLAGLVGALLSSVVRKQKAVQLLLALACVFFMIMTFFEGTKQSWYLIHILPLLAALLASSLVSLRVQPFVMWLVVCCVFSFLALNIGASLYLIHRNSYGIQYLGIVNFLKRELPAGGMVMGSAELGYSLSFESVIDDSYLGYYSHKRAPVIVFDANYRNAMDTYRTQQPEIYAYAHQTLDQDYQCVFDSGVYKVYKEISVAETSLSPNH